MKKVLLVRLSSLGDIIFNLPLANVLKNNGYEVTWIVSEKGIDIVKDNPAVDKAILIPLKKWKKEGFSIKNLIEFIKIIKDVRSQNFDVALDTQMMFKSMIWMKICKAKRKICLKYGREFSSWGGTEVIDRIPNPNFSKNIVFHHLFRKLLIISSVTLLAITHQKDNYFWIREITKQVYKEPSILK